jgi:hypothetical protein
MRYLIKNCQIFHSPLRGKAYSKLKLWKIYETNSVICFELYKLMTWNTFDSISLLAGNRHWYK